MKSSNLLSRGILIGAIMALSIWFFYPLDKKIKLGLDLQGGMHLVLQVKTDDALRADSDSDMQRLTTDAQEKGLTVAPVRLGPASFEINGLTPESKDALGAIARANLPAWDVAERGDKIVLSLKPAEATKIRELAVTQAVQTIRNRIDEFGVAEPVITPASGYRVVVQLPGVDDPERVRRLIKNVAFLEFRLVRGGPAPTPEALGQVAPNLEVMPGDIRDNLTGAVTGKQYYLVEKQRVITGRDLKTARPGQGKLGEPVVNFSLTAQGSKLFGAATGANIGTGLAIILDGKVVSAPRINAQITDSGVIEGGFTQQEVDDLTTTLRSGSLPAGLTYLEERTVGPSLGRESIKSGIRAGVIGTSMVVLALLLYYHLAGVNAVAALMLNILILFGGLGLFHSTLTLPGIAGVILTIGMAVDANVLVFERIREELRAGRTVRSAIDLGFERAFTSIIDTHVTTLVSALFLFQFGTGPVRGFAVTLIIGLLASIFTAVYVSHWIFDLVLHNRRVEKLSI
ncbi:MAG TPA: protein translocase subunit SecD [Thermoanaerobaculia bacterium]|jgi:preprotein translocase subunit SecD|nr:protein translocase subunit SecD [Thermoanaerobaculia bacterium]